MASFKTLEIYKDSKVLVLDLYKLLHKLPKSESRNLAEQIKRAGTSIVLNIAEGSSRKTAKDFDHFLMIALGSLIEVEAALDLCVSLEYFTDVDVADVNRQVLVLSKKISRFRYVLESRT